MQHMLVVGDYFADQASVGLYHEIVERRHVSRAQAASLASAQERVYTLTASVENEAVPCAGRTWVFVAQSRIETPPVPLTPNVPKALVLAQHSSFRTQNVVSTCSRRMVYNTTCCRRHLVLRYTCPVTSRPTCIHAVYVDPSVFLHQ